MPKMLVSWEHAEDRTLERVAQEQRKRVQERIDVMGTMDAPPEAVGHYNWYIEIYGGANDVVAGYSTGVSRSGRSIRPPWPSRQVSSATRSTRPPRNS